MLNFILELNPRYGPLILRKMPGIILSVLNTLDGRSTKVAPNLPASERDRIPVSAAGEGNSALASSGLGGSNNPNLMEALRKFAECLDFSQEYELMFVEEHSKSNSLILLLSHSDQDLYRCAGKDCLASRTGSSGWSRLGFRTLG